MTHIDKYNSSDRQVKILLLTNGAWDNIGDHFIEACDIALIKTAANNLGLSEAALHIDSNDLSLVTNKYCKIENPELLQDAYSAIASCTFVLLGGAPVFNYAYQQFYKKTATILRIAKELNKPVFFSAVGIDSYSDTDPRPQLLKSALHNGIVKQATTRDGIDYLKRYALDDATNQYSFPIELVSDPAVFASTVFSNFLSERVGEASKKKIGIFVFRAGGFADNGISFNRAQQGEFWQDVCCQLDAKGYDYELLTSGHYADEAMLQYLIDEGYLDRSKCLLNVNTPDVLISHISSYDGVITCRLHPSVVSFSCNVPSVSLVWNPKVTDFYKNIGYPERALSIDTVKTEVGITASAVVSALERALKEGISKDQTFVESVYKTLVAGMASCLNLHIDNDDIYTGQQLINHIPQYPGTSLLQEREKVERKFTRCYKNYNAAQITIRNLKQEVKKDFHIIYHSGGNPAEIDKASEDLQRASFEELPSGNIQVHLEQPVLNNGKYELRDCMFVRANKKFTGWKLRFRIDNRWFWCLEDGGFISAASIKAHRYDFGQVNLFRSKDRVPYIPVKKIDVMVAEAQWSKSEYNIRYNSGKTSGACVTTYDSAMGTLHKLKSGSLEFSPHNSAPNDGLGHLLKNCFSYDGLQFQGWRLRVREKGEWYWLLRDGSLIKKEDFEPSHGFDNRRVFSDQEKVPVFEDRNIDLAVAEAVWGSGIIQKAKRRFGFIFKSIRKHKN